MRKCFWCLGLDRLVLTPQSESSCSRTNSRSLTAMWDLQGYRVSSFGVLMFGILQGMYGDKFGTFLMHTET